MRRLGDESRAAFAAGNRIETTLRDAGVRMWFRLFTGADERRLPQLRRSVGDRVLSAMLGWRVLEVEGVPEKDKREPAGAVSTNALTDPAYRRAIRLFVEDLSLRDADFLVDEFDRVDCGVDTAIEVECPECFTVQEVELPFDRGFFLPGKARTARRRDRTSSSHA